MAQFHMTGPVWIIRLNNDETNALPGIINSWGQLVGAVAGPLAPIVSATLAASTPYIQLMNRLGGNRGVEVNGVVGKAGVIVTPIGSGMYEKMINGARFVVSGRTVADFLVEAAVSVPALRNTLGIPAAARVLELVRSGTPLGWAVAGGLGFIINLALAEPSADQHGGVHADRDQIQQWETFTIAEVGDGEIALLSWQGFFSARDGGGAEVFANRPEVLPWERWRLIHNGDDGTISFRTVNGHFLVAEEGGGRECWANRTAIGPWEKFFIEFLPGGQIALRTLVQRKIVSVQQDL